MRVTLDISECTALIEAAQLMEASEQIALKKARKLNQMPEVGIRACMIADLSSAKSALENALAAATKTDSIKSPSQTEYPS